MKNSSLSDSNIHKKGTDHIAIQNISPHRRRQKLRYGRPVLRQGFHRSASSGSPHRTRFAGFRRGPYRRRMGGLPVDRIDAPQNLWFCGGPDITQMGRRSPPISRFLLRKNAWRRFAAAQRCRADNPRRRKVRLSPLSPFWQKRHPLPCSSSSHRDRSAGSRREPLKKHFPPSAPSANGGLTR